MPTQSSLFKDQWGELRGWVIAVLLISFIIGLSSAAVIAVNQFEESSCRRAAEKMGREWDYGVYSDCLVKGDDGRFISIDAIREPEHR